METAIATILAAVISAMAAITVCIISSKTQHKKTLEEFHRQSEMQAYRIGELEKKMDKHNNFIERVYNLEKRDAVEVEEIKVINHRLGDLEAFHK
jgi:phosphotransacetylase